MSEQNPTVLEEAQALVYGDRQAEYGHPRENYEAIGRLFTAYLESRYRGHVIGDVEITAVDASVMMLLMKIGRLATGSVKRDTVADMAGYVAVLSRVMGLDE